MQLGGVSTAGWRVGGAERTWGQGCDKFGTCNQQSRRKVAAPTSTGSTCPSHHGVWCGARTPSPEQRLHLQLLPLCEHHHRGAALVSVRVALLLQNLPHHLYAPHTQWIRKGFILKGGWLQHQWSQLKGIHGGGADNDMQDGTHHTMRDAVVYTQR